MTQMQQTMVTMQTNISQLQTQQNLPIPNVAMPVDPLNNPLNNPPVNPLPHINLPAVLLPNQPDPMQDKLEKIENVLRKTGKIDGYLKNMCPYLDIRLPENFKFPDMDKFDGTGNPVEIGRASCRERVCQYV